MKPEKKSSRAQLGPRPKRDIKDRLKQGPARKTKLWIKKIFEKARKKPFFKWGFITLAGMGVIFGVTAWLITYTEAYKRIPARVWQKGGLDNIALMAAILKPEQIRQLDSIQTANSGVVTNAPLLLARAATAWTNAINENNPGAILKSEADSYGNLYLVLGPWWDDAKDDHRLLALDALGVAWREYLRQQFPFMVKSTFQQGVFIVDEKGRVAQNIKGRVELLRRESP